VQLFLRPDGKLRVLSRSPWRVCGLRHIVLQVAPAHGVTQSTVQHGMDVVHGVGGEAARAMDPTLTEQPGVVGVDLGGVQVLQLHSSQLRDEVLLHQHAIAGKRLAEVHDLAAERHGQDQRQGHGQVTRSEQVRQPRQIQVGERERRERRHAEVVPHRMHVRPGTANEFDEIENEKSQLDPGEGAQGRQQPRFQPGRRRGLVKRLFVHDTRLTEYPAQHMWQRPCAT